MNQVELCHTTFLLKQIFGQDSVLHQAKDENEKRKIQPIQVNENGGRKGKFAN